MEDQPIHLHCNKDLTYPQCSDSVPVFPESNSNLLLLECFSDLKKSQNFSIIDMQKVPEQQGTSRGLHLWDKESVRFCQVVQTAKMSLNRLNSSLLEIEPLKIVSKMHCSCGLTEIRNQHCNRKQRKQVKRAVECFYVVAQFVSARLNPK